MSQVGRSGPVFYPGLSLRFHRVLFLPHPRARTSSPGDLMRVRPFPALLSSTLLFVACEQPQSPTATTNTDPSAQPISAVWEAIDLGTVDGAAVSAASAISDN